MEERGFGQFHAHLIASITEYSALPGIMRNNAVHDFIHLGVTMA